MEIPVHTHAVSARIRLAESSDVTTRLRRLGWTRTNHRWLRSEPKGGTRWQLPSSAWVTGHRPSPSSGLGRRNKRWGTSIRSLNLQHGPGGWALDLETVRRADFDILMGDVLGFGDREWRVEYLRRLERFVCLNTYDALRLARQLVEREAPVRGDADGGRKGFAKAYLVRPGEWTDHATIRTRSRVAVELVVYNIAQGSTAGVWKLEARLRRRGNQSRLTEADGQQALDAVLRGVVESHELRPIQKPALWEPRASGPARRVVGHIAGLRQPSWRGKKPDPEKYDTPPPGFGPRSELVLVGAKAQQPQGGPGSSQAANQRGVTTGLGVSSPTRSEARSASDPTTPGSSITSDEKMAEACGLTVPPPLPSLPGPCLRLLERPGTFIEFVHGQDDDPVEVGDHLIEAMGTARTNTSCCLLTTAAMAKSLREDPHFGSWMSAYPLRPDLGDLGDEDATPDLRDHLLVLVLDPTVLCRESRSEPKRASRAGEAATSNAALDLPEAPLLAHQAQRRLADLLEGLRVEAERTGLRVALVSPHAKPTGQSNVLDGRLRSLAGDAGRFYAHVRMYRPRGRGEVEVWKDEVDGRGPGVVTGPADTPAEFDGLDRFLDELDCDPDAAVGEQSSEDCDLYTEDYLARLLDDEETWTPPTAASTASRS